MYRVAQLSGLDERTISKVEAGKQNPMLYTLPKIARAQGVTLSELLSKAQKM
jgi:transcriptional regulator with XRE-family HTH domain